MLLCLKGVSGHILKPADCVHVVTLLRCYVPQPFLRCHREQQQFRLRNDVNAPKGSSEARLPYDMLLALEESNVCTKIVPFISHTPRAHMP